VRPPIPAHAQQAAQPAREIEQSPSLPTQDLGRLPELEIWMRKERAYRRPEFQLGDLAQALGLPEYRTRKLIHEGLGFRNFNVFVNHYRIEEVEQRLRNPGYDESSILTLALEAGFGSLAPFNKAFKAEIGSTPSDYRRIHCGGESHAD
jgi:AraC-like DNA-binding protein